MTPIRILLIDDDNRFRESARQILIRSHYEVHEARNGREALGLLATVKPNLVITDIIMPEKEGIETILEIRQLNPSLPIIAMSGGGRLSPDDCLLVAQKLGARRTLAKPFSSAELLDTVASVVGESGSKEPAQEPS